MPFEPQSPYALKHIIKKEYYIWFPFCLFTFFLTLWFMTGNIFINLSIPFLTSGDGIFFLMVIQRTIEGWYWFTDRLGFPFGGCMLDFPLTETGILAVIKFFSLFTQSPTVIYNLIYLLGFPLSFFTAYIVLRTFHLKRLYSISASFLFAFLPFHFMRLEHLFTTWYFVIPLYFYYGYNLFNKLNLSSSKIFYIKHFFYCLCLSMIGAYFTAIGSIVVFISGAVGSLKNKSYHNIIASFAIITSLFVGLCLNLSPNLVYIAMEGKNPVAAVRHPSQSETYGLKLTQLLLPRPVHSIASWAKFNDKYNSTSPISNENAHSSLGIMGSLGFLSLLGIVFIKFTPIKINNYLQMFSLSTLFLFLFITVGGFSSLFALLVSSQLRAWNRGSVFIGFASLGAIFYIVQLLKNRFPLQKKWKEHFFVASVGVMTALAFLDQSGNAKNYRLERAQHTEIYKENSSFIKAIENLMPPGSAIYELPYSRFPESILSNSINGYELGNGFIYSKKLRWSYGVIAGREGDKFFAALEQIPLPQQLAIAQELGFQGLYVDVRPFPDKGKKLLRDIKTILKREPDIISSSHNQYYFILPNARPLNSALTPQEAMENLGYSCDELGLRYNAPLSKGIDFRKKEAPLFLKAWRGLSHHENWGRWSDGAKIQFIFQESLPQKFTLGLRIKTYENQSIIINIGDERYTIDQAANQGEMEYRIPFSLNTSTNTITFIPSLPISPHRLGRSEDTRKLAIGFIRLWIE